MTVVQAFAIGAGFAFVISLVTVLVLRPHLVELLEELCGTRARASFWMVVSSLSIFLLGILAGTVSYGYEGKAMPSAQELFFGLVTQVRAGLIGLLVSLLAVAWVLLGVIRRFEKELSPAFALDPGLSPVVRTSGAPVAGPVPANWQAAATPASNPAPTVPPASPSEPDPARWQTQSS